MPALPSLSLLGDEVKSELDAQERRFDALDSKAGIVVGFAGVLVPLSLANLHGVLAHVGAGVAGLAALLSALAFLPRRTPALDVRELRLHYLTSDEDFTKHASSTLASRCTRRLPPPSAARLSSLPMPFWLSGWP